MTPKWLCSNVFFLVDNFAPTNKSHIAHCTLVPECLLLTRFFPSLYHLKMHFLNFIKLPISQNTFTCKFCNSYLMNHLEMCSVLVGPNFNKFWDFLYWNREGIRRLSNTFIKLTIIQHLARRQSSAFCCLWLSAEFRECFRTFRSIPVSFRTWCGPSCSSPTWAEPAGWRRASRGWRSGCRCQRWRPCTRRATESILVTFRLAEFRRRFQFFRRNRNRFRWNYFLPFRVSAFCWRCSRSSDACLCGRSLFEPSVSTEPRANFWAEKAEKIGFNI